MTKVLKFWAGLGLAAMAGQALADAPVHASKAGTMVVADNAGEGGEGGEGGDDSHEGLSDVDYFAALGFVEGHMTVGVQLYKLGHKNAAVHMKHPADELYADLLPAFEKRKLKGFATELEALSSAVETGKPAADLDVLLAALSAAIRDNRGEDPPVREVLDVALAMTRTAADEFAIGVVDGKIANDKEYQDAWGFVTVARTMIAAKAAGATEAEAKAIATALAELDGLQKLWPDITGEKPPGGAAADIAVAAAKIEIAALQLKQSPP